MDTFTSSNSEGYTCSDISVFRSYGYEDLCSDSYDTIEFTASESCVACGGGQIVQDLWYETEEVEEVTEDECDDSMWDDRTDVYGDGCSDYTLNPLWCFGEYEAGDYDDFDFTSNEMCCACGGGDTVEYILYQPATICVNTDHDNVNSDGYPCSYLNILHDNENIAYDCETQADTSAFTASDMCSQFVRIVYFRLLKNS